MAQRRLLHPFFLLVRQIANLSRGHENNIFSQLIRENNFSEKRGNVGGSQPMQLLAGLDGQKYLRSRENELGHLPACPPMGAAVWHGQFRRNGPRPSFSGHSGNFRK